MNLKFNFQLTRKRKLIIAGILLTPILIFALYTWSALSWSYAEGERAGSFERASGGTLFIDEVGELDLELQPRLLRVLETRDSAYGIQRLDGLTYAAAFEKLMRFHYNGEV